MGGRPPGLLFAGGPILTIADPERAEAIAVIGDRILSADPTAVPLDDVGAIAVLETWLGGERVV